MAKVLDQFRFVLIAVAGWMNQAQEQVIETSAKKTACCASNSVIDGCGLMTTSVAV